MAPPSPACAPLLRSRRGPRPSPALALAVALLGLCAHTAATTPQVREYNLTLTYGLWAPDCVQKQLVLVNGAYPGPLVWGMEGDTLRVTVHNMMMHDAVSVHWHGIRQLNNNLNDGAALVTQCPIGPRETYTYTFQLDKAGTYFYHGHLGIDKSAGVYGMLVAYQRQANPAQPSLGYPEPYDAQHMLLLSDWYHASINEQVALLTSNQWVGQPQSLLLNGVGAYNCSLIPSGYDPIVGDVKFCNASAPQCGKVVLEVEKGKKYRLRIANAASLVPLNLAIEAHSLKVVAADAYEVEPFTVGPEGLDSYTGQTVDVIFTANQPVGNYWIRIALFGYPYDTPYGLGIIRYKGAAARDPATPPPPFRDILNPVPSFSQTLLYKGRRGMTPAPAPGPFSPLVLVSALQLLDGRGVFTVNNVSLELPATPYALGIAAGMNALYGPSPEDIPFTPWNYSEPAPTPAISASNYYTFPFNAVIDIVLQSTANPFGDPEYHPWHMHGHHFFVLGQGFGTYDPKTDPAKFNLVNPPFRYTVGVMPGGWAAIRFRADNPGAWLLHCHIEYHHVLGMQIVFIDGHVLPLPTQIRKCGDLY